MCSPKSDNRAPASMNLNPSYTLASSPQTGRVLRGWHRCRAARFPPRSSSSTSPGSSRCRASPASRITSSPTATSTAWFPASRSAWWRRAFSPFRTFPRRIPAAELLRLQAACAADHTIVERDHDLSAHARLPGAGQRRLFARLDRAVLFHDAGRADRAALLIVRVTALARAAGLISAQRFS